ncbi:MAG: type IV toxin-antitoxin system AbiEi family antitoxin domain-containing protein [Sneathiella sp.]
MTTLTRELANSPYAHHVFTETQLARIIGGSDQRRYGLVNRALKSGELVRVKRGLYVLSDALRSDSIHPFHLAQALHPGSYISLESALAYHGWIPEAVYTTTSVVLGGRSRQITHETLGQFTFTPLALERLHFLELVDRLKVQQQTMLVAKPIRALMDLVYARKVQWQGIAWLEEYLRIDGESLLSVTSDDVAVLKNVYKHSRMQAFLGHFEDAVV